MAAKPTFQGHLFNEPDLGRPEHDRIAKWLDRKLRTDLDFSLKIYKINKEDKIIRRNIESYELRNLVNASALWPAIHHICEHLAGPRPSIPAPRPTNPEWEVPLRKGSTKSPAGFIDIAGGLYRSELHLNSEVSVVYRSYFRRFDVDRERRQAVFREIEEAVGDLPVIVEGGEFKAILPDLSHKAVKLPMEIEIGERQFLFRGILYEIKESNWKIENRFLGYCFFEVKTVVESIGKLLRQLSYYRDFLGPEARIILVAPGDAIKQDEIELLARQKIGFIQFAE